MTSLYGSEREPEKVFGKDTEELEGFHKALFKLCPGAVTLLNILISSWQKDALAHEWSLPDGFNATVKVFKATKKRIAIEELGKASFTYMYYENQCVKKGVKNAANVVHSLDAYLLRSLLRRCNYDRERAEYVQGCITNELLDRNIMRTVQNPEYPTEEIAYYCERFEASQCPDVVILPFMDEETVRSMTSKHLKGLARILEQMLVHEPFEVITVHDDFKCHPNHMNHLRNHYRHILADMCDSTILEDILGSIYGFSDTVDRFSTDLSQDIRKANYALS